MNKRGLGRGLEQLLGGAAENSEGVTPRMLPAAQLRAGGRQPRQRFDQGELQALADSIRRQGVIQPVIVRPRADGYEIVAGERRWRAAQMAGLQTIPVVVRHLSDKEVLLFALAENLQRADLNPLEQARGLARLVEELNITHAEAAANLGLSRPAVSNLLRLLSLCAPVLQLLENGKLDAAHARALLPLSASQQQQAALQIVAKKLSARAAENLAKSLTADKKQKKSSTDRSSNPDTRRLETDLSASLSARVEIRHRPAGSGKLTIHYGSLDSLQRLLKKLQQ